VVTNRGEIAVDRTREIRSALAALHGLWGVRLACVALAAGWLFYEWNRWPDGSALLGPLGFIRYNGPDVGNVACCVVALLVVLAFPLKPSGLTAVVSVLGVLLWLFLGAVAHGIGC
jgi:hypothetical protein